MIHFDFPIYIDWLPASWSSKEGDFTSSWPRYVALCHQKRVPKWEVNPETGESYPVLLGLFSAQIFERTTRQIERIFDMFVSFDFDLSLLLRYRSGLIDQLIFLELFLSTKIFQQQTIDQGWSVRRVAVQKTRDRGISVADWASAHATSYMVGILIQEMAWCFLI